MNHHAHAAKRATPAQLRSFGAVMLVALGVCAYVYYRRLGAHPAVIALGAAALLFGALGLAAPALLGPAYRLWMALGKLMGRVTTPVLLTVVFVTVLVPLRAVLGLFGKDPLNQRFDKKSRSYWSERTRRAFTPEDFKRLS